MAARWTWPTRRSMKTRSVGLGRVAAAAPIHKSVSCRWWKMARTCCSAAKLLHRGNHAVENRAAVLTQRHAVPGRPAVFRLRTLEASAGHRCRSVMARQEEYAPGMRRATSRRVVSEPDLSVGAGLAA